MEVDKPFSLYALSIRDFDIEVLMFFIGFFYGSIWVLRFVKVIYRCMFGTQCTTLRYGEESWAIVTGAASGLGREAAIKLASIGFNLIIIGNN